jgi:hypothetical protein
MNDKQRCNTYIPEKKPSKFITCVLWTVSLVLTGLIGVMGYHMGVWMAMGLGI